MPKYLACIEKDVTLCTREIEIETENKDKVERILWQMLEQGELDFEESPYYVATIRTEIEEALY